MPPPHTISITLTAHKLLALGTPRLECVAQPAINHKVFKPANLGEMVRLLPCDLEITGWSHGNSLLQKGKVNMRVYQAQLGLTTPRPHAIINVAWF
ncbi:hypothetical protein Hanom_Chr05g00407561 [Helianthus anomalus]